MARRRRSFHAMVEDGIIRNIFLREGWGGGVSTNGALHQAPARPRWGREAARQAGAQILCDQKSSRGAFVGGTPFTIPSFSPFVTRVFFQNFLFTAFLPGFSGAPPLCLEPQTRSSASTSPRRGNPLGAPPSRS